MIVTLPRRAAGAARAGVERIRHAGYRFEPVAACLCGETSSTRAARGRFLGRRVELRICAECGLGRQAPRLTAAGIERYYETDYRRLARGTAAIEDAYFERGRRRGERLIEFLAEVGVAPDRDRPVLELGAGAGGILDAFRTRGFGVSGSDLDPACVDYALSRGLPFVRGELPRLDGAVPAGLVVLSHVAEHLPDPLATLASLRRLVDGSTLLYVEVPGLRAGPPPAAQLRLPHLYYYDLAALTRLLERAGWTVTMGDERVVVLAQLAGEEH